MSEGDAKKTDLSEDPIADTVRAVEEIMEHGYGEVNVKIDQHRVKRVLRTKSYKYG